MRRHNVWIYYSDPRGHDGIVNTDLSMRILIENLLAPEWTLTVYMVEHQMAVIYQGQRNGCENLLAALTNAIHKGSRTFRVDQWHTVWIADVIKDTIEGA